MSELRVIPVAHDFTCPWCWAGLFHAKRLKEEFGVEIEWRGHALFPEELPWPEPRAPEITPPDKPSLLSRFEFLKLMDGIDVPKIERPKRMRIDAALEAVEYFKERLPSKTDDFVEDVYRAYWERGERIGDVDLLSALAKPYLDDTTEFESALGDRRYKGLVIGFDAPSYKVGVFNVPTFWIGGERFAEQPYMILERAMKESQAAPAK